MEGYVVDNRGRVRGEAKKVYLYSRIGEILLYDIDSFGYVSRSWSVMSEQDLMADKRLSRRLYEARYQVWKRHCVSYLRES